MSLLAKPLLRSYTWPLFGLLSFCFASAILGDSTAEALLLARFGSEYVPGLFLINALALFVFSTVIMSVIDRTDRGRLFVVFMIVHGLILLSVRGAVAGQMYFLYPMLFSYAYVTKILSFLIFWTLTNDLVDSHRAGTEFPFIAAGGTLGAIAVSFLIPTMLRVIAPENLLAVWACATLFTGLLILPIIQSFGESFKPVGDRHGRQGFGLATLSEDLQLVRSDPLLRSMAILYFLLFFVTLNQHYSFYSQLKLHFEGVNGQARELARFLGYFNGISMCTTLVLQMTISGRVIRNVGSSRSLLILPIAFFIVFGMLAVLSLVLGPDVGRDSVSTVLFWGVVAGVGTRIAFFDSFYSPNFQIFFSSLPQSIRGRGKLSMEGVVKPLAMVSAGLWLFLVAPRLPFAVNMGILCALSGFMIVQTLRLKKRYTESLAQYLHGFKSKNTQLLRTVSHSSKEVLFFELVGGLLRKEESSAKSLVIDTLSLMSSKETISILVSQIPTADTHTRASIVSALGGTRSRELKEVFLERLTDENERVVANAIEALAGYRDSAIYERLRGFLNNRSPRIRANAVVALWPYARESERAELMLVLRNMLATDSAMYSGGALYALGRLRLPDLVSELGKFYRAHTTRILHNRTICRQFVLALGRCGRAEAVDVLLELSGEASRKQRYQVCVALGMLINRGVAITDLIGRLTNIDYMRRTVILKTLHLRPFERRRDTVKTLQNVARQEIAGIYAHWLSYAALEGQSHHPGVALLKHAIVEECVNESLRSLIYLASMLDDSGQVRRIVHRLFHSNKHVRGQAFEVLDNTGDFRTNRMILKLLDSSSPEVHAREAMGTFRLKTRNCFAVVNEYTESPNAWVRECATSAARSILDSTPQDPRSPSEPARDERHD